MQKYRMPSHIASKYYPAALVDAHGRLFDHEGYELRKVQASQQDVAESYRFDVELETQTQAARQNTVTTIG